MLTDKIVKELFKESYHICYYSIDMAMDMMCEWLEREYGIDATWNLRSIYINNERVMSVEFSHEARCAFALYKIRTYNNKELQKVYDHTNVDVLFEGYLDDNQEFYDYHTGNITGSNLFDTTKTGVSDYDDMLRDPKYWSEEKNLTAKIVELTPLQYYRECATKVFNTTVDSLKMQRQRDVRVIEHLNKVIDIYGKQFPMTYINYAEREQEGLHRMFVAGERFGWNTKFPVMIVNYVSEERAQKEKENKHISEVQRYMRAGIRNASYYRYYSIDELKDQLISSIYNELRWMDEFEDKDLQLSLDRDDIEGGYTIIVNDKYTEFMSDEQIRMEDKPVDDSDNDIVLDDVDDELLKYIDIEDIDLK